MAGEADTLMLARLFAKTHGLLISEVHQWNARKRIYVTAYVVYRKGVRLGRRSRPGLLLALLKSLVPQEAQVAHG